VSRRGRAAARARAARQRSAAARGAATKLANALTASTPILASRDDPGGALHALAAARDAAAAAVDAEVNRLRAGGPGWPVIGRALGVTRQAVRQRSG